MIERRANKSIKRPPMDAAEFWAKKPIQPTELVNHPQDSICRKPRLSKNEQTSEKPKPNHGNRNVPKNQLQKQRKEVQRKHKFIARLMRNGDRKSAMRQAKLLFGSEKGRVVAVARAMAKHKGTFANDEELKSKLLKELRDQNAPKDPIGILAKPKNDGRFRVSCKLSSFG